MAADETRAAHHKGWQRFRIYRVTYQRSARHDAASAGQCAIGSGELSAQERMAGDGYAGVIAKEPFAKPFLESLANG